MQNLEFIDREGSHMQGTLFREMVDVFINTFTVGNVYEISQGVVKVSSTKYTQAQNENCFVFDKFTKVKEVAEDSEIAGGEMSGADALANVHFSNLESIAES